MKIISTIGYVVVVAGLTIAVVDGECMRCVYPIISNQMTLSFFQHHFPHHAPIVANQPQNVCPMLKRDTILYSALMTLDIATRTPKAPILTCPSKLILARSSPQLQNLL